MLRDYTYLQMYISEVSPNNLRGTMGAVFSVALAMGLPAGYCCGIWFNWRHVAEIGAAICKAAIPVQIHESFATSSIHFSMRILPDHLYVTGKSLLADQTTKYVRCHQDNQNVARFFV